MLPRVVKLSAMLTTLCISKIQSSPLVATVTSMSNFSRLGLGALERGLKQAGSSTLCSLFTTKVRKQGECWVNMVSNCSEIGPQ